MGWQANLALNYRRSGERVVVHHTHSGPLRVLQSLYPEGDGVCHSVLVHPPGGLVGGDTVSITVHAAAGTHALITTPGATRFYRSAGAAATQECRITLEADARLEWLPLETLCYDQCLAHNHLHMALEPGAELMGWDLTALGLPHARLPFRQGALTQHLEVPGVWLERAHLDASDHRLLHSAAGLGGRHCMATLFLVCGSPLTRARLETALDTARACITEQGDAVWAGVTSPHAQVVVLRALAHMSEPAMQLLRTVRTAWRQALWNMQGENPRLWSM